MRKLALLFAIFFLSPQISFATEGLKFENKYMHPGKADYHYRHTKNTDEFNTIWWSPGFKGGWGYTSNDNGTETEFFGGYMRPLLPKDGKGELILGFLQVKTTGTISNEFQGEYRFPMGLGIGGGFVDASDGGNDIEFGKVNYRNKFEGWSYIVSTQYQEFGKEEDVGGWAALYDDNMMFVYGNDGEHWRTSFGYVSSPNENSKFRPAFETLFVDNSWGDLDGSRFLFINATLKFKGGFLSHPARLGRAMGPTGLEYGNPLGFSRPTWNRRLDPWELGDLVDFRLVRTTSNVGVASERYEVAVYPFQFCDKEKSKILDRIYVGGFHDKVNKDTSGGFLAGIFGKLWAWMVGVGADYNPETEEKRVFVGVIDKF